ncbi:nucleoside-diphosphate kinase [Nematocida sp. AWRm80]|nr:nucleoside-diphosphate kinase [Nematocida sp. AWRm80]
MECTYVMIKPDGVKRRLVGEIVSRLEKKGYGIAGMAMGVATKEILEKHYCHLVSKPFFPSLVEFMTSGPVVKMIITGHGVVDGVRRLLGETNPREAAVGTIRGDLGNCVGRNLCHASDSVENAKKEIDLWMGGECIQGFSLADYKLVYEK